MQPQELEIIEKLTLELNASTEALNRAKINVSSDRELWTSEQCAEYLGMESVRSFTEYVAPLPHFPDAVPIPTARSTVRCSRRWVAKEVQDWALSNREKLLLKRRAKK